MHAELSCDTLAALKPETAIRAIHQAWLQLSAADRGIENLDNGPALAALRDCLRAASHIGFTEEAAA